MGGPGNHGRGLHAHSSVIAGETTPSRWAWTYVQQYADAKTAVIGEILAPTVTKAKEGRLTRNHPTLSAADNSSSPTTNRTKTRVRLTAASSQALQPSHGTARLLLPSLRMVESVRYDRLGSVTTTAIVTSTVPCYGGG